MSFLTSSVKQALASEEEIKAHNALIFKSNNLTLSMSVHQRDSDSIQYYTQGDSDDDDDGVADDVADGGDSTDGDHDDDADDADTGGTTGAANDDASVDKGVNDDEANNEANGDTDTHGDDDNGEDKCADDGGNDGKERVDDDASPPCNDEAKTGGHSDVNGNDVPVVCAAVDDADDEDDDIVYGSGTAIKSGINAAIVKLQEYQQLIDTFDWDDARDYWKKIQDAEDKETKDIDHVALFINRANTLFVNETNKLNNDRKTNDDYHIGGEFRYRRQKNTRRDHNKRKRNVSSIAA